LLLLCSVSWIGVAYAFPSDHEIAFAKAYDNVDNPTKTAGCLIVWGSSDPSTKNIYCRYKLQGMGFFIDYIDSVLSDIKLGFFMNQAEVQQNLPQGIKTWFKNKYQSLTLTPSELAELANIMSQPNYFISIDFGGKERVIYQLDNLSDVQEAVPEDYKNKSQKQFAYLVHYSIEQPLRSDNNNNGKRQLEAEIKRLKAEKQQLEADKNLQPEDEKGKLSYFESFKKRLMAHPIISISLIVFSLIIIVILSLFLMNLLTGWLASFSNKHRTAESQPQQRTENQTPPASDSSAIMELETRLVQNLTISLEESLKDDLTKTEQNILLAIQKESRVTQLEDNLTKKAQALQKAEHDLEEVKNELVQLRQGFNNTKDELNQTQATLENERTEHQNAEKNLKNVDEKRDERQQDLDNTNEELSSTTDQYGCWRWLQPALLGEMMVCEPIVKDIKDKGTEKDQQISELLQLDSIMKHWATLVGQFFKSDDELWMSLRGIDGGNWLNQLLRADDVLQTYFPDEESFKLLSQHLSNVNGILQATFMEMGRNFLIPKILEKVPSYVPAEQYSPNRVYMPKHLLKALVKQQVLEKYQQGARDFVVDIETYGFGSNAATQVRVLVFDSYEW